MRAIAEALKAERLSKDKRADLVKELNELLLDDVPAREAVRAFVEARVLRDVGIDALGVSPPWMVEALAKTTVGQSFANGPPSVWGRWCVDPMRRPFVEAQLLACDDARLSALIERAVKTFDRASLGAVAAVEALFVVVGERLAREPRFASKRMLLLKHLARLAVGLLAPHFPNGLPAPRTRGGPHEPSKGGAEFVAASWAWSLHVEEPLPTSSQAAWLFPGWLSPSLDQIPDALMFHDRAPNDGAGPEAEERGVKLMSTLLPEVIARATGTFTDPGAARRIPRNFVEAAIPLALRRGWPLAVLVRNFRDPSEAESSRVALRINALPDHERARTIDALWEVVLADRSRFLESLRCFEPDEDFRRGFPRSAITALLLERFPVEEIEGVVAATTRWDEHTGDRLLRMTPLEYCPRVARALAKALASQTHTLIIVLKAFGRDVADVLVEEAARPGRHDAWLVAQAVWEVAPERALELAKSEYGLGNIAPWITSIPEAHLSELVAVVEEHPAQSVPDALRFWLARHLGEVGPEAERVWALLVRAGWPVSEVSPPPT